LTEIIWLGKNTLYFFICKRIERGRKRETGKTVDKVRNAYTGTRLACQSLARNKHFSP